MGVTVLVVEDVLVCAGLVDEVDVDVDGVIVEVVVVASTMDLPKSRAWEAIHALRVLYPETVK